MRLRTIFIGLCLAVAIAPLLIGNTLDTNMILKSIATKETNERYWLIGSYGERTEYQFMENTWKMYSKVPFQHASEKEYHTEVDRVARAYLRSIIFTLGQEGKPITPHNVALKWTGGLHSHNYIKAKQDYADCVSNLYGFYFESQQR